MKTLSTKLILLFGLALLFQGCATKAPIKKNHLKELYAKLGNFDKFQIPNEAPLISHMISVVQPELEINSRNKIANDIHHAIKKYNVEPQIIVALIDTESNFSYSKVSSTGDLSIGQVNVEVWNREFKRMKLPLIEKHKLITEDQSYAMEKMAQILSILKVRHAKKDRRWYARYHSNTSKLKLSYLRKIEVRMKMLAQSSKIISSRESVALASQNTP